MDIENYDLNCTDLQKKWHKYHKSKGLSKFIYDGIVNEDLWAASNKKIMFLLKEAYLKNNETEANLCKWFNEGPIWKMWWTVSDWVYALQNVTSEWIPAYYDFSYNNHDEATERIRSSAVVNLKKSEGESNTDFNNLMKFVDNDKDYIKAQILEINPEIIVCGNTHYCLEVVFDAERDNKGTIIKPANYKGFTFAHDDLENKGFAWAGDTLIINFCHPANRFDRMGKYYALSALYQQALKEKEETTQGD